MMLQRLMAGHEGQLLCEAWILVGPLARLADDPHPEQWPRPLTTAAQPWGQHHLNMRELKQLQVGTVLHLSILWLILHHIIKGGIFMSEHSWKPKRVSSDYTPCS